MIFSLEPLTALVVGVLWLKEVLLPLQLVGALLILLAMFSAELLPRLLKGFTQRSPKLEPRCDPAD